jgi:hypothetical protein
MMIPADASLPADEPLVDAALPQPGRARAEALHRLQIGLAGLAAMVMMIGLASVIMERAQLTEARSVPDAAATTAPEQAAAKNDPLAQAGVVPDMPAQQAQPADQATATGPEQGNGPAAQ